MAMPAVSSVLDIEGNMGYVSWEGREEGGGTGWESARRRIREGR
jgi:hypothetical protein